jgi:type IV pilus assembly protein PilP
VHANNNVSHEPANASSENRPGWIDPPSYRYDAAGKDDPFVPFIQQQESTVQSTPDRPLTPLERVEVTQLRVVGILWHPENPDESLAMVELPDGKGFVLKKGVHVGRNNGQVVDITENRIVVKEEYTDIFGKSQVREVPLKLHVKSGGGNG